MGRGLSSGLMREREKSFRFRAWACVDVRAAREQAAREALSLSLILRRGKASDFSGGLPRRWDGASLRLGREPLYNLISGRRFGRSIILLASGREARDGPDQSVPRGLAPGWGAVTGPIPDEANGLEGPLAFRSASGAFQDRPLGNDAGLEVAPERNGEFARHGDDGDAPHAPLLVADALAEPLGERAVGLVLHP